MRVTPIVVTVAAVAGGACTTWAKHGDRALAAGNPAQALADYDAALAVGPPGDIVVELQRKRHVALEQYIDRVLAVLREMMVRHQFRESATLLVRLHDEVEAHGGDADDAKVLDGVAADLATAIGFGLDSQLPPDELARRDQAARILSTRFAMQGEEIASRLARVPRDQIAVAPDPDVVAGDRSVAAIPDGDPPADRADPRPRMVGALYASAVYDSETDLATVGTQIGFDAATWRLHGFGPIYDFAAAVSYVGGLGASTHAGIGVGVSLGPVALAGALGGGVGLFGGDWEPSGAYLYGELRATFALGKIRFTGGGWYATEMGMRYFGSIAWPRYAVALDHAQITRSITSTTVSIERQVLVW